MRAGFMRQSVKAGAAADEPSAQLALFGAKHMDRIVLCRSIEGKPGGGPGGRPQNQRRVQRHAGKAVGRKAHRAVARCNRDNRDTGGKTAQSIAERAGIDGIGGKGCVRHPGSAVPAAGQSAGGSAWAAIPVGGQDKPAGPSCDNFRPCGAQQPHRDVDPWSHPGRDQASSSVPVSMNQPPGPATRSDRTRIIICRNARQTKRLPNRPSKEIWETKVKKMLQTSVAPRLPANQGGSMSLSRRIRPIRAFRRCPYRQCRGSALGRAAASR